MNSLIGEKGSADLLLGNKTVLASRLSIPGNKPVPVSVVRVVDALASSLKQGFATGGAKESGLAGPPALSGEGGSAVGAGKDGWHGAVAGREVKVNPTPTPKQIEAGNWQKGHVRLKGLEISVENLLGSTRKLAKREGSIEMRDHYGYIRGFTGADNEKLDVYVKDTDDASIEAAPIFAVEQLTPDGKFDEDKVYMGYDSDKEVRASFLAHQQLKPAMRMGPKIRKFDDVAAFRRWAKMRESQHQKLATAAKKAAAKTLKGAATADQIDVAKLPAGKSAQIKIVGLEVAKNIAKARKFKKGRDLKLAMQDEGRAARAASGVDLREQTQAAHNILAQALVADAVEAMKTNSNAIGWYDDKVSKALSVLALTHPEIATDKASRVAFIWALAVTSNGQKVAKNFELAQTAYAAWKATGKMPTDIGIGNPKEAINNGMELFNALSGRLQPAELERFLATKFTVGEIEAAIGVKPGGEWTGTVVRGAAIAGPKVGNGFLANLMGFFDALTMDRWFMRTWGRITGDLVEVNKKEIAKKSDALAALVAKLSPKDSAALAGMIKGGIDAAPQALAEAIDKVSQDTGLRETMQRSAKLNAVRLAARALNIAADGSKEAPSGPGQRAWIRTVMGTALRELQVKYPNLTMADLQALLWYPEKKLYDSAKEDGEEDSDSYSDDEAPDYANASVAIARAAGFKEADIQAALSSAGSVASKQVKPFDAVEKAAFLRRTKAPPEQTQTIVFEVAPDPENVELTAQWNALSAAVKKAITRDVGEWVTSELARALKLKVLAPATAFGGFGGQINPNQIAAFAEKNLSYDQAQMFAAAVGKVLDQASMVLVDSRSPEVNGVIRITTDGNEASKNADEIWSIISKAIPEIAGDGFTARGKTMDVLNLTKYGSNEISDVALHDKVIEALTNSRFSSVSGVSYGKVRSALIGRENYDGKIDGVRLRDRARVQREIARITADARARIDAGIRDAGGPGLAGAARLADGAADGQAAPDVRFRLREEGGAGSAPDARGAQAEQGQVAPPKFTSQKIQKDAVSAVGIHYGKAGLKALDPTMAGTGAAGGERRRLGMGRFGLTNPRVNFYIREPGQAVPPSEAVVGGAESYQVELMNLYDYDADPRGFFAKYPNNVDMVEEEVTDAGFDGILFPKHPQIPVRTAIVFGFKRKIPVVPVPAGEPVMDLRYALKPKAQSGSTQFKQWFGDSKVVDSSGKPMVVYHGTHGDFTQFEQPSRAPDLGFHFGTQDQANQFVGGAKGANVMPVFLKIENPLRMDDVFGRGVISKVRKSSNLMRLGIFTSKDDSKIRGMSHGAAMKYMQDKIKAAGYDGIVYDNVQEGGGDSYAVFDQTQIKSATGNSGEFDGSNPDIMMSVGEPKQSGLSAKAVQGLVNTLNWAGKDKIRVFDTVADLPLYLQQSIESGAIMAQLRDAGLKTVEEAAAKGVKLDPRAYDKRAQGFYDPASKSAVVIAGNIDSPEQAYRTIVEEHLRHEGFRRFFTPAKLDQFLDGIYSALPQEGLRAVAKTYSANLDKPEGRRLAAEEYIAKMKLYQERSPLMARVGDWVRGQLRSMGFKMTYSNRDVIHILQQIEDGVRSGRIASPAWNGVGDDPVAPMYSLSGETDRWYYSAMLRSVETGTGAPKKAGATQWKQWLDGAQRRGEFKQAEREWIGVDEWLDGRGDTTTRAELVEFVNSNQVMVDETVLSNDATAVLEPMPMNHLPEGFEIGFQVEVPNHYVIRKMQAQGGRWYVEKSARGRSRWLLEDGTEEDADAMIRDDMQGVEVDGQVKFDSYQLPGGQNYRELLLTMPAKKMLGADELAALRARSLEIQDADSATKQELDELQAVQRRIAEIKQHAPPQYQSTHFDQPNILAHVRFNERTDADGKRVLFVEEVQSDWHQAGRKKGYGKSKYETKYMLEHTIEGRLSSRLPFATRAEAEEAARTMREAGAGGRFDVEEVTDLATSVPDAPLKKEWPLSAMKRMIRWAAENGFDRIAWTTGDQQAERYDLSKQIESIGYDPKKGRLEAYDKSRRKVIDKEGVSEGQLEDYIGKEVAKRLLETDLVMGKHLLDGEQIKVGGEGMRGFYDKMLPTEVGKYVKKFGGQVAHTGLRNGGGVSGVEVMNSLGIPMNQQAEFWANADRDELIEQYRNNGQRQPSIDITPAMRQAAIAGQPLFRLRDVTSTPEIEGARRFISGPRPAAMSLGDRVRVLMRDIYRTWTKQNALEIEQGLFDSGASIKDWEKRLTGALQDASESAGKMYDLARNPAAVLASVMRTGVPKLIDGAFQPVAGRKGLIDVFRPLYEQAPSGTTLVHLWEDYAAARRSSRLITEQNRDGSSREKQLSEEQIKELLKLGGQYLDENGNSIFEQVFDDWQAFNSQMLDFAVENGVLSAQMRKMWAANDYVPFYRVIEELTDQAAGNSSSSRLTGRQVRSKRLTGGVGVIEPIFESIVKNSAYVLDSVYKNETMKRTVKMLAGHALTRAPMSFQPVRFNAGQIERALQNAGIVMMSERDLAAAKPAGQMALAPTTYRGQLKHLNQQELDNWNTMFTMVAPAGSNVVSVMIDGKAQYYFVDDPLLLRSIQAIGPQSMSHLMKFMSGGKELLTNLVTTDPGFMAVNFLRDTISAWVTSSAPFKPVLDGFKGALDSFKDDPLRWKLQTAGASLGGYYDTRGADAYAAMELDTGSAPKLGIRANWRRWQRFGAHFENANRMAIARSIIDSGGTVAEAAYQALDIMNFSMHGDSKSIRALTMTVPFMNARLQGLYRLWRGRNAASFWQRGAIVAGATLALMFKNWDDDRYWELEEFERDSYWHFWLGDEHIKIAKPFEVGQLFGTIWERTAATAFGPDTARLLIQRMGSMAFDTFAMNPVPQIVKPIIEQYANKNSFTGRPIENQSLQGLLPEQRYMPWTSESARVFAAALPDWAPAWLRSPVRVEALVRGYMGTLGLYALQASDQIARPLGGFGEPPAMALKDMPVVRRFYGGDTATRTKYEEPIYKLLDIANETRKSVMELRRRGDAEGANEIAQSNADILAARGRLNAFSTQMRALNMQERAVWNSSFTAEEKKVKIDALRARRNDMLRQSAELLEKLDPYLPYL